MFLIGRCRHLAHRRRGRRRGHWLAAGGRPRRWWWGCRRSTCRTLAVAAEEAAGEGGDDDGLREEGEGGVEEGVVGTIEWGVGSGLTSNPMIRSRPIRQTDADSGWKKGILSSSPPIRRSIVPGSAKYTDRHPHGKPKIRERRRRQCRATERRGPRKDRGGEGFKNRISREEKVARSIGVVGGVQASIQLWRQKAPSVGRMETGAGREDGDGGRRSNQDDSRSGE